MVGELSLERYFRRLERRVFGERPLDRKLWAREDAARIADEKYPGGKSGKDQPADTRKEAERQINLPGDRDVAGGAEI